MKTSAGIFYKTVSPPLPSEGEGVKDYEAAPLTLPSPARGEGKYIYIQEEILSPSRDCVPIGRGGMKEEASAGYGGIQRTPPNIRKGKAVSKDCRRIKVFSPPSSMEESLLYDSERMPSRPIPRVHNYDILFEGGGTGWG
jgi:hypothetical protein